MGRGPSSRIAVQRARILSVGLDTDVATRRPAAEPGALDRAGERGAYVTLEVAPDEAEVLAVARSEGRLDLVLRNATDDAVVATAGATLRRVSAFDDPTADAVVDAPAPTAGRRVQLSAAAEDRVPRRGRRGIEVINAK
jgi:Flp pilus assembly protein CpaB